MVASLAELPFARRAPLPLLNLDADRFAPDPDYAGFGYARAGAVVLTSAHGPTKLIRDPLVIAVHSADDQEPGQPLDLEFELDVHGEEVSFLVPFDRFVEERVRPLLDPDSSVPHDVVLVMCNPHRARIDRPAWLGERRLHYADGDVESWLDRLPDGRTRIRLTAPTWNTLR